MKELELNKHGKASIVEVRGDILEETEDLHPCSVMEESKAEALHLFQVTGHKLLIMLQLAALSQHLVHVVH